MVKSLQARPFASRLIGLVLLLGALVFVAGGGVARAQYTPGADITSALNTAIAAGSGNLGANKAVITLPAGQFNISSSINLHGSVIKGAGAAYTILNIASDLGSGVAGFTGDSASTYGNFEIDDCTIEGPRPSGGVPPGSTPNQMDGIHLYDDCVLRRCNIQYFHSGVIVDGNHHTIDTVASKLNYNGVEYVVSTDGTYFDDYYVACSFTANGFAGFNVDANSKMSGYVMRTHLGFEPYGIFLGHDAELSGSAFLQMQFEGVGNGDIVDSDGTSAVGNNYFTNCSGWGGYYANALSGRPVGPSLNVGTFEGNDIVAMSLQGPTPGDMSIAAGIYGNTWTCDASTLTAVEIPTGTTGTLPAPVLATAAQTDCYANVLNAGGIMATLNPATSSALTPGEIVEANGSRTYGVVPCTGTGAFYGVALGTIASGSGGWVAHLGRVFVATGTTFYAQQPIKASATGAAVAAASVIDGEFIGVTTSATGAVKAGFVITQLR